MKRRDVTLGLGGFLLGSITPALEAAPRGGRIDRLAAIEHRAGGRLGAYVLDTGSGRGFGWRGDERFGMCSTFKLSLAALILREVDAGRLDPCEVLAYTRAELLPNSPVTGANAEMGGMDLLALAEAGQKTSDNLAANLLLRRLGGPAALTAFWRALGDKVSRLDRFETDLNFVSAREVRDTTSPRAIAHSAAKFLVGDALKPASRALLFQWMADTRTGAKRLRGGLPVGWRSGDKTGTGMADGMAAKINDIAILFPPGRAPRIAVAFYEPAGAVDVIRAQDEAVLADVGRIAASL